MKVTAVEIFILNIDNDDIKPYLKFFDYLSMNRKKKIERYLKKIDKKLSICSELLIKLALSLFTKKKFDDIGLFYEKNGSISTNLNEIYISLSHTESIVVLAISQVDLGVDVERVGKFDDLSYSELKNILTENEKKYFFEDKNNRSLSIIWTRKEAFGKYNKKGIVQELCLIETLKNSTNSFFTFFHNEYVISMYSLLINDVKVKIFSEKEFFCCLNKLDN